MPLSPIDDILVDLKAGKMIVLVDDEQRENEGDFVCAAEHMTIDIVNFMTRIGGGYLCVAMTGSDCDRLALSAMAPANTSLRGTPMTITVDGHPRHGVGTGISSGDRVKTIQMLVDPASRTDDFVRPGHINPLRARDGGVLVRTGQTEGSVDLCKMAGLRPAAVIIEIVRPDGEMARMPDLELICQEHGIKMGSVEQIIARRLEEEPLVSRMDPIGGTIISTPQGDFNLVAFQSTIDPLPHLVLIAGDIGEVDKNGQVVPCDDSVLVRVHRRDLLGDIFDTTDRPTGRELRASMRMIQEAGRGVLVYLRPEVMGDGVLDRLLKIQRPLEDDVNAPDLTRVDGIGSSPRTPAWREIGTGCQILRSLGISSMRVLTNNPMPLAGIQGYGLDVVDHVPIEVTPADLERV
jgi:3,4-dihydroxy 2-butanone 4-phosphate synthase/GTP cyclohydrolase II